MKFTYVRWRMVTRGLEGQPDLITECGKTIIDDEWRDLIKLLEWQAKYVSYISRIWIVDEYGEKRG